MLKKVGVCVCLFALGFLLGLRPPDFKMPHLEPVAIVALFLMGIISGVLMLLMDFNIFAIAENIWHNHKPKVIATTAGYAISCVLVALKVINL